MSNLSLPLPEQFVIVSVSELEQIIEGKMLSVIRAEKERPKWPKYLRRSEVAKLLNVKPTTIDKYRYNGKIERLTVNGGPRYDRDKIIKDFHLEI